MTAEEFMEMPDDPKGVKYELVRGKVREVREPAAPYHGIRVIRIGQLIANFLDAHPIALCSAESLVALARNPDTARAPDIFVTRKERFPRGYAGGLDITPDLVIEIRSPSERSGILQAKMRDYFAAGTTMVWVVEQLKRTVTIHTRGAQPRVVQGDERLTGDPVLPGFSCTLDELFQSPL
jgi:Uma2 family endonuclease